MKKILLVEDTVAISSAYKEILETPEITVEVVADGYVALERINNSDWDVLLLDIMLPKLDGFSILQKMNSTKLEERKPVIVMTNIKDDELKSKCILAGATDFYVKSEINLGEFVTKIHNYLGVNVKS